MNAIIPVFKERPRQGALAFNAVLFDERLPKGFTTWEFPTLAQKHANTFKGPIEILRVRLGVHCKVINRPAMKHRCALNGARKVNGEGV